MIRHSTEVVYSVRDVLLLYCSRASQLGAALAGLGCLTECVCFIQHLHEPVCRLSGTLCCMQPLLHMPCYQMTMLLISNALLYSFVY
jgi:hypothetical protein